MNYFSQFDQNSTIIITTVASIAGTFIATYWGLSKPRKIVFIKSELLDIYRDFVERESLIDVTFKGNKIHKNTFFIYGILYNCGSSDILEAEIDQPIRLHIEKGKLLETHVISQSDQLNSNITIERSNVAKIAFRLFKRKEYIKIVLICEFNEDAFGGVMRFPSEYVWDNVNITHRINNISAINIRNHPSRRDYIIEEFITISVSVLAFAAITVIYFNFGIGNAWYLLLSFLILIIFSALLGRLTRMLLPRYPF